MNARDSDGDTALHEVGLMSGWVSELVIRFVVVYSSGERAETEEASSSRRFMGKYGFAMKMRLVRIDVKAVILLANYYLFCVSFAYFA